MSPRSIKISVKPEVFQWLRESSGWTLVEVSKYLGTSVNVILSFEKGTKKPSLKQLEKLAKAYHRPLAAFLLAEPQKEKPLPKDYRQIPNKKDIFDSKTILAIRKARHFQNASKELSQNIDEDYQLKLDVKYSINDNPNTLADSFRDRLSLTIDKQKNFRDPYQLFNYLRKELGKLNIFTFQFPFPLSDARGFVLSDEQPVVIVVNSKDLIKARNFTLMHEFAHILLGETVIDLAYWDVKSDYKQEKWCSEFASTFLLPKNLAKNTFLEYKNQIADTEVLNSISNKLKLSKAMLLYNFFKLDLISNELYNEILNRFQPSNTHSLTTEGGPPPATRCISSLGEKFITIVSDNFERKQIYYSEALHYLSIKSKNFDKVITKVSK